MRAARPWRARRQHDVTRRRATDRHSRTNRPARAGHHPGGPSVERRELAQSPQRHRALDAQQARTSSLSRQAEAGRTASHTPHGPVPGRRARTIAATNAFDRPDLTTPHLVRLVSAQRKRHSSAAELVPQGYRTWRRTAQNRAQPVIETSSSDAPSERGRCRSRAGVDLQSRPARSSASSAPTARQTRRSGSSPPSAASGGEARVMGYTRPGPRGGLPAHRLRRAERRVRPAHERPGELVMQGACSAYPSRGPRARRSAACRVRARGCRRPSVEGTRAACAAASTSPWHGPPPACVFLDEPTTARPAGPRRMWTRCAGSVDRTTVFLTTTTSTGGRPVRPARDHRPRPDRGRGHAAELKRASRGRVTIGSTCNGDSSHG